jgi:hypothetical protein
MHADKFSTLEEGIYLLNHSVGRPPVSAYQQVQAGFIEPWQTMTNDLWPRWIEEIDEFRKATALLLNASWQDICPQTNLSGAPSKLLPTLPYPAPHNPWPQRYCLQRTGLPLHGLRLEPGPTRWLSTALHPH